MHIKNRGMLSVMAALSAGQYLPNASYDLASVRGSGDPVVPQHTPQDEERVLAAQEKRRKRAEKRARVGKKFNKGT